MLLSAPPPLAPRVHPWAPIVCCGLPCDAACRQMVSRPVFADAFWKCYNTLKATATPEAGMPGYFRFLTLLSESLMSVS